MLRIAEQIRASNVMVNANLATAQAAEILFRLIGASAIKAVGFLMVDPLHFEPFMQAIPSRFLGPCDFKELRVIKRARFTTSTIAASQHSLNSIARNDR